MSSKRRSSRNAATTKNSSPVNPCDDKKPSVLKPAENSDDEETQDKNMHKNNKKSIVTITHASPGPSSLRAQYFSAIKRTPPVTAPHKRHTISKFTFPASTYPKTTNKTAGATPYPTLLRKKLTFQQSSIVKPTKRNVNGKGFVDYTQAVTMNKLFYEIL